MVSVNVSQSAKSIVLCGKGRIGGALAERLERNNIGFVSARVNSDNGLYCPDGPLPRRIGILIICISAGQKSLNGPRWHWRDIFDGLVRQLSEDELEIDNIVLVSSTRVYEGLTNGLITASTNTSASSIGGQGLISAEQALIKTQVKVLVLRCSGLFGDLYPRYTPILKQGADRPRFGVEAEKVVDRLFKSIIDTIESNFCGGVELMTDGMAYYLGDKINLLANGETVSKLAEQFKIFVNSSDRK